MNAIFLSLLNKGINTYLNLDPESKPRMQLLQNKVIAIELLPFHFNFQIKFTQEKALVTADELFSADAIIGDTPLQLFGVTLDKENRQQFFSEDIKIEGNAEFAQQVILLFDELEIDWEAHLAKIIGDVPAYHLHQMKKKVMRWLNRTQNTFAQDISEYLHEEIIWFPTQEALQDLFADIDVLRMDVDRIEARIKQLSLYLEGTS